MIPTITNEPPYISATSIPVRIANESAVPITGNTNTTIINDNPIPITGTTTIEGDEDHPLPTKIISDEDHPVLVDVVNETFNAYVNNPSPIDVNVVNQLELPQSYPITSSSSLSVTETNPIQLPLEYPIANPYYENILIHVHSSLTSSSNISTPITSFGLGINCPFNINIENFNEWFFSVSNFIPYQESSIVDKYVDFYFTKTSKINTDNYATIPSTSGTIYGAITYNTESIKISFKGDYTSSKAITTISFRKGNYTSYSNYSVQINFYCRAKAYYTYLNN